MLDAFIVKLNVNRDTIPRLTDYRPIAGRQVMLAEGLNHVFLAGYLYQEVLFFTDVMKLKGFHSGCAKALMNYYQTARRHI